MKHLTIEQLLSYLQNELSSKESLLLEIHLKECIQCQNELVLMEELQEEWMNPPIVNLPDDVIDEIMLKIEEMPINNHSEQTSFKRVNSKKVRLMHLTLAACATFLFFQFQFAERITNSNRQVVQTIEQTSRLIEKSEKIKLNIPKFWKGWNN